MRILALAAVLAVCGMATARTIKPYDPKPQSYEVEGKEMSAAEAQLAFLAGKTVKLCKAMSGTQSAKTYRVGGKEIKGTEVKTCTEQELVGTKNGSSFKAKK